LKRAKSGLNHHAEPDRIHAESILSHMPEH
jgi:hypothetical protein